MRDGAKLVGMAELDTDKVSYLKPLICDECDNQSEFFCNKCVVPNALPPFLMRHAKLVDMETSRWTTVTLKTVKKIDFSCHVENGKVIVDKSDGISPADGLSLFSPWMLGLPETVKE